MRGDYCCQICAVDVKGGRVTTVYLLSAILMLGADPVVKLPDNLRGDAGVFIPVRAETNGKIVKFKAEPGLSVFPSEMLKDPKTTVVVGQRAGRFKLWAWTALADAPSDLAETTVIVGDPGPPPLPPIPPQPPPVDPPVPPPNPAPIPEPGFRVLVVFESSQLSQYPKGQVDTLYAQSIRDYLNSKCVVGKDGATKEWRMYDQNVFDNYNDPTGEHKVWSDAMKRARTTHPWIIISDGKAGFEGPLPATPELTLELLRKYGH